MVVADAAADVEEAMVRKLNKAEREFWKEYDAVARVHQNLGYIPGNIFFQYPEPPPNTIPRTTFRSGVTRIAK